MSNEAERDPKQQQGKHDPAGPVNPSDTKTNPFARKSESGAPSRRYFQEESLAG